MKTKILFSNLGGVFPYLLGGAEISMHTLLLHLRKEYYVLALGSLENYYLHHGLLENLKSTFIFETKHPYCIKAVNHNDNFEFELSKVIYSYKPNIIITQLNGASLVIRYALANSIRVIFFIHSLDEIYSSASYLHTIKSVNCEFIVVSEYLKKKLEIDFNKFSKVIYPFIDFEQYKVVSNNKKYCILFADISLKKGLMIALKIAKNFPHETFIFIDSYPNINKIYYKKIEQLENVILMPFVNDMKFVYKHTKLVILPSICQEAFGRVIVEAGINNILTVGSNRGGISEVISSKELLVNNPDDINEWIKKIYAILSKSDEYAIESINHYIYIQKFNLKNMIDRFKNIIEND